MPHERLSGKVAIVTGGGSGIGRAVCQVFAREGASVAVLDINVEGMTKTIELLSTTDSNKHCKIKVDIVSSEQVKQSLEETEEKLGKKANIVVNCAGITKGGILTDVNENDFDDVIRINLKGTFLMCKEFVKSLKESDMDGNENLGTIVNISSISGIRGFIEHTSYASSKFGVIGLTKTTASEYQTHRVRCNAVLPGATETPILQNLSEEFINMTRSQIPMNRFAKPEEIANACLFLASDESSYVNGACLEVCGGWAM